MGVTSTNGIDPADEGRTTPFDSDRATHRELMRRSPVPMIELDCEGTITALNEAAVELLQCSDAAEALGTAYVGWIDEGDRREVRRGIERAVDGVAGRIECRSHADRGGRPCRARFLPLADASDRVMRIVATLVDRTSELAAGDALRRSEERLRQVLDLVPHLIFAKDREGRFVLANKATASVFDLTPDQLLGLSHADLHTGEDEDERFRRDDLEVIESGRMKHIPEEELTHADGTVSYLRTTKIPFVRVGTDEPAVLGLAIDVTEDKRRRAERERLEEKLRQRQKLESLGVLAGGIAHDFNNLLQSIRGNAELLREHRERDPEETRYLDNLDAAAEQASKLCRQMLAYSGRGSFVVRDVGLNDVLRELAELLEVTLADGVEMDFDLASPLPLVRADTTQLTQLVMNLLANASDAVAEAGGGTVRLRTRVRTLESRDLASVYVHDERPPGRYVVLEVEDDGIGMDDDTLERLFDPFFSTKFPGRGLGLSAVIGIVRGHGGSLQVDSRPNAGSCFRVQLPVAPAAETGA